MTAAQTPMDFPESVKLEAKGRAHYQCVVCRRSVFLNVHHLTPQKEDGPGVLDNAVPLCVECHDLYGNDANKRKWLREARDFWWLHCANLESNPATLAIREGFDRIQTQVSQGHRELLAEVKAIIAEQLRGTADAVSSARSVQEVVEATSSTVSIYGSATIIVPSPVVRGTGWVTPPPSDQQ